MGDRIESGLHSILLKFFGTFLSFTVNKQTKIK